MDISEIYVNDEKLLESTTEVAREEVRAIEDLYNYYIENRNKEYD